jgi:hypothetical protein
MSAKIIDGKAIASEVCMEVAAEVAGLKTEYGVAPGLAVVLVGDDPASKVYVGSKVKKCQELGIYSEKIVLPKDCSEAELLARVAALNANKAIHEILVSRRSPQIDEADSRGLLPEGRSTASIRKLRRLLDEATVPPLHAWRHGAPEASGIATAGKRAWCWPLQHRRKPWRAV